MYYYIVKIKISQQNQMLIVVVSQWSHVYNNDLYSHNIKHSAITLKAFTFDAINYKTLSKKYYHILILWLPSSNHINGI